MIGFPSNLNIHLALEPQDLRKSFNGLAAHAGGIKSSGLEGGCIFAFTNMRRNFHEVIESGPHPHAAQILLLIGHLMGKGDVQIASPYVCFLEQIIRYLTK